MARTLIGVLMMSLAAGTGAAQQSLRVGEPLPTLKGQFLTGRNAVLPQASSGKVTLIARGFTYASRVAVEAWADWYRSAIGSSTDITFFEVPMIGGLATHKDEAYLIVLDKEGVVRWLHHGVFDTLQSDELKRLLTSLADRRPIAAGRDPSDPRLDQ